jgi:hypothetical protein
MAEKTYYVAPGKAVSCKRGIIGEGEVITPADLRDPVSTRGMKDLTEQQIEKLKQKLFTALAKSPKNILTTKAPKEEAPPAESTEDSADVDSEPAESTEDSADVDSEPAESTEGSAGVDSEPAESTEGPAGVDSDLAESTEDSTGLDSEQPEQTASADAPGEGAKKK